MKNSDKPNFTTIKFVLLFVVISETRSLCDYDRELESRYSKLFHPKHPNLKKNYIGQGAYGVVLKTGWADSQEPAIIHRAVIKRSIRLMMNEDIEYEAQKLVELKGAGMQSIPKLYACFKDTIGFVYLVSEYIPTSLETYNQRTQDNTATYKVFFDFDVLKRLNVYRKMALLLEELHEVGFLHGDIKPGNILADDKTPDLFQGALKFIDFGSTLPVDSYKVMGGSATHIDFDGEKGVICGIEDSTEISQADREEPKLDSSSRKAWKADILALAATIYQMENDRKNGMVNDSFYYAQKINCANLAHSNAKALHAEVVKDDWIRDRGLDFPISSSPTPFKDLMDIMTQVERSDRRINAAGVRLKLQEMIAEYPQPSKFVPLILKDDPESPSLGDAASKNKKGQTSQLRTLI